MKTRAMDRRRLLTMLGAAVPAFAAAEPLRAMSTVPRLKITDIKLANVRVVKELGSYDSNMRIPASPMKVTVGGGAITEIYTDQGVVGWGPGISPAELVIARARFIGADPFDIGLHARVLQTMMVGRWGANFEIAMWDLIGKACNQPLAKLWGGGLDRVMPYGATMGIGTGPDERARTAAMVKAHGYKAVKMRASFPTLKQDIEMMEKVRRAVGDDFIVIADANKAGPYISGEQMITLWDAQRAMTTARAYQDLGVYWLEEPLNRYDYSGLARVRDTLTTMRLAGGEANAQLSEFKTYLDRGCYDILNPDCAVIGPTLWRQVADLAFAHNTYVVPHALNLYSVVCHIHLAASQPQFAPGDQNRAPHMEIQHNPPVLDSRQVWSIFTNAPQLDKDGYLPVPTEPGLGVTIQPDLIQRT